MSKGTTVRKVRIPDESWDPAADKAAAEGTDRATVLRVALDEFLTAPPREWPTLEPGKASRTPQAVLEHLDGPDAPLSPTEAKRLADRLGLRRDAVQG